MADPIEAEFRELMNRLAEMLDNFFNADPKFPKVGFTLLTFNFGDNAKVNYISNADRADMLATMKAFIARAEGRYPDDKGQKWERH